MIESCYCSPKAGNGACDLTTQAFQYPRRAVDACPKCGLTGKSVQRQTIKALLSLSLRQVQNLKYFFCRTQTCPVVYFSAESEQTFTISEVRERIYQKEPEADDVLVCYCFGHTISELRTASSKERMAIVDDINIGINAEQCACDLRNPQGSCCLGNVRGLIKRLELPTQASHSV